MAIPLSEFKYNFKALGAKTHQLYLQVCPQDRSYIAVHDAWAPISDVQVKILGSYSVEISQNLFETNNAILKSDGRKYICCLFVSYFT